MKNYSGMALIWRQVRDVLIIEKHLSLIRLENQATMRKSVILPQPEGLIRKKSSPFFISKLTRLTAITFSNDLLIFCMLTLVINLHLE